jgi:GNAT superfamily N-acetyltransferase
MKIRTREATETDAAIIADFNAAMAKETENIELDRERLRKGTEALFTDSTKGVYFLAEADCKVVGQLMITYEWSDWRNATFWWIQSVYVHPEYRHQGIFRSLYRAVETIARERGDICGLRLYVDKTNKHAQQTYEALGMKHSHYQMMDVDFTVK